MSEIALQSWLYQKLSAEVSTPVYDVVPDDATLPYIVIDSTFCKPDDFLSGRRKETHFIYLSVWSNYAGQKEVKQIIEDIDNCLRNSRSDDFIGALKLLRKEVKRDEDGITFIGSVSFQVIVIGD